MYRVELWYLTFKNDGLVDSFETDILLEANDNAKRWQFRYNSDYRVKVIHILFDQPGIGKERY